LFLFSTMLKIATQL